MWPGFAEHSEDTFLVGEREGFVVGEPTEVVRLLAEDRFLIGLGDQEKPYVVMFVRIVDQRAIWATALGDEMHVEVERHELAVNGRDVQSCEPSLFTRFAKRDFDDICFAVGMTPGLEPAIELRMMHEQAMLPIVGQYPRRAGDVTRTAGPLEAIHVFADERANPRSGGDFVGIANEVSV